MTIYCNHKTVLSAQAKQTDGLTRREISTLVKQGIFPADTGSKPVKGTIAAYEPLYHNVYYDPEVLACLSPVQVKSVILHEAGHAQQVRTLSDGLAMANGLALWLACVCLFSGCAAGMSRRGSNRDIKKIKRRFVQSAACATAWLGTAAGNAEYQRHFELDADQFATRRLNDAAPMQQALSRMDQVSTDAPIQTSPSFVFLEWNTKRIYGPFSDRTHPSIQERIKALSKFKPMPEHS